VKLSEGDQTSKRASEVDPKLSNLAMNNIGGSTGGAC